MGVFPPTFFIAFNRKIILKKIAISYRFHIPSLQ